MKLLRLTNYKTNRKFSLNFEHVVSIYDLVHEDTQKYWRTEIYVVGSDNPYYVTENEFMIYEAINDCF